MGAEVYHVLKNQLASKGLTVSVGDEGGFAPKLSSNEEAFKQLEPAIKTAKYKINDDFALGLDAASSEFFDDKKGEYELKGLQDRRLNPQQFIRFIKNGWLNIRLWQ